MLMILDENKLEPDDRSTMYYAVGLLSGLYHKYGGKRIDMVIYNDSIRVRIDEVERKPDDK